MFHSRALNNRINKIHEKALRLAYKDEAFLSSHFSLSIHQKNLKILATESYKTKIQKTCNLRNDPELQRRRNRTVYFGTEGISSLVQRIWELIPSDIRNANSIGMFKKKKFWTTDKCPCRLCKTYIGNVGFI